MAREMILIPKRKYEQFLDKTSTPKIETTKLENIIQKDETYSEKGQKEPHVQMTPKDFFKSKDISNSTPKDIIKSEKYSQNRLKQVRIKPNSLVKQKWLTFHV